jgi:hypothetical protein
MLKNGPQSRKSKLTSVEQPRVRLKLAPGQPTPQSKLTDAIEAKICDLIANGAGYEQACLQSGITRATFWNWRVWGTADPKGRYGRFFAAVRKALRRQTACRVRQYQKMLNMTPRLLRRLERENNVPRGL